ncbi:hypothetical protein KSD_52880 [Ktedonobacter sp. SOSP1-85]|nr:hypothetical protein KSD_52880 [Ktedonobacter sp. SOSP1-85]
MHRAPEAAVSRWADAAKAHWSGFDDAVLHLHEEDALEGFINALLAQAPILDGVFKGLHDLGYLRGVVGPSIRSLPAMIESTAASPSVQRSIMPPI